MIMKKLKINQFSCLIKIIWCFFSSDKRVGIMVNIFIFEFLLIYDLVIWLDRLGSVKLDY